MYQRPSSPLSIGGVLDDGFRLLKASFTSIIGLSLLGAILNALPNFLLSEATPENAAGMSSALGLVMLVTIPLSMIVFGAIVARIFAIVGGGSIPVGEALGVGVRRVLPLIGWVVLYMLAFLLGTLLLVVPGIIFGLSLSFGAYLVISDGLGPVESLRRSHRLVWGNWWRTAVLVTVILFIMAAVYVLIGLVGGFGVAVDDGPAFSSLSAQVVTILATAAIAPVSYCFSIAILNDLKLRKQGADLEQRMEAIEAA